MRGKGWVLLTVEESACNLQPAHLLPQRVVQQQLQLPQQRNRHHITPHNRLFLLPAGQLFTAGSSTAACWSSYPQLPQLTPQLPPAGQPTRVPRLPGVHVPGQRSFRAVSAPRLRPRGLPAPCAGYLVSHTFEAQGVGLLAVLPEQAQPPPIHPSTSLHT